MIWEGISSLSDPGIMTVPSWRFPSPRASCSLSLEIDPNIPNPSPSHEATQALGGVGTIDVGSRARALWIRNYQQGRANRTYGRSCSQKLSTQTRKSRQAAGGISWDSTGGEPTRTHSQHIISLTCKGFPLPLQYLSLLIFFFWHFPVGIASLACFPKGSWRDWLFVGVWLLWEFRASPRCAGPGGM